MRLTKLPRSGHWEVELVRAPDADPTVPGIVLVIDASARLVRLVEPVTRPEELAAAVMRAATAPLVAAPGRPKTIRCREAQRSSLVEVARALGASLQVAGSLPVAEEVAAGLLQHVGGPEPLLPADASAWRPVVAELMGEAPWEDLSDSVQFRFVGAPEGLREAVAIVLGLAGEQYGVTVFASARDHETFLAAALRGTTPSGRWSCWCAHFDRAEDLPPEHVKRARELGLVCDDLVLQVFGMGDDGPRVLTPAEVRRCLAAVQGVIGAWRKHGGELEHMPTLTPVQTSAGLLRVATAPPSVEVPWEDLVLPVDHQAIVTSMRQGGVERRTVVMKLAKRDAERLKDLVRGVDALSFEARPGGEVDVVAWVGARRLGVLCRMTDVPAVRALRGPGLLVIASGGARRSTLRQQDVLEIVRVSFLEDVAQAAAPRDDGMFRGSWRDAASWLGPPETWPKASTVLLDFAEPLGVNHMTSDQLEHVVKLASTIWTAVVLADETGDRRTLDDLRRHVRGEPLMAEMVESLIERKRSLYAQDRRLMVVKHLTVTGGRADVSVSWRLP